MAKSAKPAASVRRQAQRLAAARDALDVEAAERRRREDAAFTRYAEASARAETIAAERDGELARLEAERVRVQERAGERFGEVEATHREVLAELHAGGRSAADLAALFELPTKRVRTLLRAARAAATANRSAPAATGTEPAAVATDGARSAAAADDTIGDRRPVADR